MHDRRRRFELQVLQHLDAACRYARWLGRNPERADDVVQEAVLRAYRGFDAFRGGDPKVWLMTIVRNCHFTHLRREHRHDPAPDAPDVADLADHTLSGAMLDPESAQMRHEVRESLAQLVALLPEEQREVLVLREVEDLDYREIAAVAGIPIGTVMSRLARARATLRRQWLLHTGESRALP